MKYKLNTRKILTNEFKIKSKIETKTPAKQAVTYGNIDFKFDNSIIFPEFYNN